jgi:Domain of unknown function (DUF4395)
MRLRAWMDGNLATQGYCLSAGERRALGVGLRFPTALCFALVTVGVVLESWPLLLALSAVGLVAGFTARHPFDHLWNWGVRHVLGAPPLPPNPTRRRHAFKVGTAWLLLVAGCFAAGWSVAGLALGASLLAACGAVTVLNLCIPSLVLSLLERRRPREALTA